jgi:hypothetical protein
MMRVFDELNEENFVPYASHSYNNPQCLDINEFYDDLARFKYIKRLLRKYKQSGEIQERLVLNHLIILYNVFGIEPANKMLWSPLKTFLVYLNYLPEHEKVEIPIDFKIATVLRQI